MSQVGTNGPVREMAPAVDARRHSAGDVETLNLEPRRETRERWTRGRWLRIFMRFRQGKGGDGEPFRTPEVDKWTGVP